MLALATTASRRLLDMLCRKQPTTRAVGDGRSAYLRRSPNKDQSRPEAIFPASRPARPLQGRLAHAWAYQRRTSYLTKWKQRPAKIKPPNTRRECRLPMRAIAPTTRIPTPNIPNMTFVQVFDKRAVWLRMLPARRFGAVSLCSQSVIRRRGPTAACVTLF